MTRRERHGQSYQSFLHLDPAKDKELADFFNGRTRNIPAGVCSIKTPEAVWIVCPRRLFTLASGGATTDHQEFCANLIRQNFDFGKSAHLGIWSEVKLKYSEDEEGRFSGKKFDYTFDYVICPLGPRRLSEAAASLGFEERKLQRQAETLGFCLGLRDGELFIEDYPCGPPLIVEVMTSSTSGGNKQKGTTIQNAFRRAILGEPHDAPGINYRQIWARMVSQLIVKSQIGKAWGGRAIWVLQDSLVNYISETTDLNLRALISTALGEVNLLSLKYLEECHQGGILALEEENLYAGKIPPVSGDTDFNRLLQAGSIPPVTELERRLLAKRPRGRLTFETASRLN